MSLIIRSSHYMFTAFCKDLYCSNNDANYNALTFIAYGCTNN